MRSDHIVSVARLEFFRALNFTDWRVLGPYNPMARMESFRALKLSELENYRALKFSRFESSRTLQTYGQIGVF